MWGTDSFEYVWEDDEGKHIWHVIINYQAGYEGNNSGSHDAFYEDLRDEYEIAAVLVGQKRAVGCEIFFHNIEIDDVMEKELIQYYIEQQEGSTNDY